MNSIISSILSSLILVSACINMLPEKIQPFYKVIPLYVEIFLISLLLFTRLGNYNTFAALFCIFINLFFLQTHIFSSCIFAFSGYIISVTLNYICLMFAYLFFNINIMELNLFYSNLFSIFFFLLSYCITYLLGHYIKKNIYKFSLNRKLVFLIFAFVSSCTIIFIFNFTSGERLGYPPNVLVINSLLFLAYFTLTGALLYFIVKTVNKAADEKRKIAEYENLRDYTKNLENLYQQMRSFRHDYLNILTTMDCYFEQNDYSGLDTYFHTKILSTKDQFTNSTLSLGTLGNLHVLELKSIIYQKLMFSSSQCLHMEIHIPEVIDTIPSMDSMDLARVIGIFLDNAIEAAAETDEKTLFCGILKDEDYLTIIIKNSCSTPISNLNHLYDTGYTTKEDGHGIGLPNAQKILSRYPNVLHKTNCHDNYFLQQLKLPEKYSSKGKRVHSSAV